MSAIKTITWTQALVNAAYQQTANQQEDDKAVANFSIATMKRGEEGTPFSDYYSANKEKIHYYHAFCLFLIKDQIGKAYRENTKRVFCAGPMRFEFISDATSENSLVLMCEREECEQTPPLSDEQLDQILSSVSLRTSRTFIAFLASCTKEQLEKLIEHSPHDQRVEVFPIISALPKIHFAKITQAENGQKVKTYFP